MMIQQSKNKKYEPEIYNTASLLKKISAPTTIKLLSIIHKQPYTYSELNKILNTNNGLFGFYIRKALKANLIEKNKQNNSYKLTFKGLKTVEFIDQINKLANLSIDKPENADAIINLDQNRTWLEPLLRQELRRIAKN